MKKTLLLLPLAITITLTGCFSETNDVQVNATVYTTTGFEKEEAKIAKINAVPEEERVALISRQLNLMNETSYFFEKEKQKLISGSKAAKEDLETESLNLEIEVAECKIDCKDIKLKLKSTREKIKTYDSDLNENLSQINKNLSKRLNVLSSTYKDSLDKIIVKGMVEFEKQK